MTARVRNVRHAAQILGEVRALKYDSGKEFASASPSCDGTLGGPDPQAGQKLNGHPDATFLQSIKFQFEVFTPELNHEEKSEKR